MRRAPIRLGPHHRRRGPKLSAGIGRHLVTQTRGSLGIRESGTYNSNNFTIQCTLAPYQAKLFGTLSEGDMVKLLGTGRKAGAISKLF